MKVDGGCYLGFQGGALSILLRLSLLCLIVWFIFSLMLRRNGGKTSNSPCSSPIGSWSWAARVPFDSTSITSSSRPQYGLASNVTESEPVRRKRANLSGSVGCGMRHVKRDCQCFTRHRHWWWCWWCRRHMYRLIIHRQTENDS